MKVCGRYLGDNDATCPQLTCIRNENHRGECDNVFSDADFERTMSQALRFWEAATVALGEAKRSCDEVGLACRDSWGKKPADRTCDPVPADDERWSFYP